MTNRGFDELESAQREVARAIRRLASGLGAPPASGGGRAPVAGGPGEADEASGVAERLLDGLRRTAEPIGRAGSGELRIGELLVERLAGGGANRILPATAVRLDDRRLAGGPGSLSAGADGAPANGVNAVVAGDATAVASSLGDAFEPVTRAVRDLTAAVGTNTGAVSANTSELGNGLRSVLGGFLQADKGGGGLLSFLKGGLGIAPLALQIAGLFGKDDREPDPLRLFDAPASIAIEAANSEGVLNGLRRTDRDQLGGVRAEDSGPRRAQAAQQPQVVVQVSAMDSQSFMDRSGDIARALRDAMLHMHPVNDVIGEI